MEYNEKIIRQQFWYKVINDYLELDGDNFLKKALEYGIEYDQEDRFCFVLLSRKLISPRTEKIEHITRNTLVIEVNQWFQKKYNNFMLLEQTRPIMILENADINELVEDLQYFTEYMENNYNIYICCYYNADIRYIDIIPCIMNIKAAEKEDIAEATGVYSSTEVLRKYNEIYKPSLPAEIEEVLMQGNKREFIFKIREFVLEKKRKRQISSTSLKTLRIDIEQTVHCYLKKLLIPSHRVMLEPEYLEPRNNAHTSVENFLIWLSVLAMVLPSNKRVLSTVDRVDQFIRSHISETIAVEDVARYFYISRDYLSRIVKNETGKSLSQYIIYTKLQEAKIQLTTTDILIGEIAKQLGYDDCTYFTRLFHKNVGCSPKDYRKGVNISLSKK